MSVSGMDSRKFTESSLLNLRENFGILRSLQEKSLKLMARDKNAQMMSILTCAVIIVSLTRQIPIKSLYRPRSQWGMDHGLHCKSI